MAQTFGYLQQSAFTIHRMHIYRHTGTAHVLYVYVGLAQARPNKVHEDSGEKQSNNASPAGQPTSTQEWDGP